MECPFHCHSDCPHVRIRFLKLISSIFLGSLKLVAPLIFKIYLILVLAFIITVILFAFVAVSIMLPLTFSFFDLVIHTYHIFALFSRKI